MNAFETIDRSIYGATESNGLVNGSEYHAQTDNSRRYTLAEVKAAGGHITRVRLFQEMGRVDVSYIHATLGDGRQVEVTHPLGYLIPKNRLKKAMLDWAQSEKVFAKSIGLIDEGNWSVLR